VLYGKIQEKTVTELYTLGVFVCNISDSMWDELLLRVYVFMF